MASQYGIERARGAKEAARQLAVLRERWPIAFPVKSHEVCPLAVGAVGEIAAGRASLGPGRPRCQRLRCGGAQAKMALFHMKRLRGGRTPVPVVAHRQHSLIRLASSHPAHTN